MEPLPAHFAERCIEHQRADQRLREQIAASYVRLDAIGRTIAGTDPQVVELVTDVTAALEALRPHALTLQQQRRYVTHRPHGYHRSDDALDDLTHALARCASELAHHHTQIMFRQQRESRDHAHTQLRPARARVRDIAAAARALRRAYDTTSEDTQEGVSVRINVWHKVIELADAQDAVTDLRVVVGELSASQAHSRHAESVRIRADADTNIIRLRALADARLEDAGHD